MATNQDRFTRKISFVLQNGIEIFPVRMERRDTGKVAFRISKGGNKLDDSEDVDEEAMIQKVLTHGYAVRCCSLDGKVVGLYKSKGRSVREVRINT